MNQNLGRRLRVAVLALALMGTATVVGVSVVPTTAGAVPVNLIQNGNFEAVSQSTSTFLTVRTGDSSTISNWTVVTPSRYSGVGSVDLVSKHYWNAEAGKYSIDLAGSTGVPGGLFQNVTTTTGEMYSLSFWSAINGQESPGVHHKMGVTVNGSPVDTVRAVSVGRLLDWVQNTVTFTASSTTSRIEFDDATPGDTIQGPTLDNVSLTAVPDVITASPANPPIGTQTTGSSFTTTVATFTDSYYPVTPPNLVATINWGDGSSPSAGTISQSGATYTVSGTYSYATHGSYTVGVSITDGSGGSASTSDPVSVADAVTPCTGEGCSGNVSTPSQNVQIDSTSTTGTIFTSVDPADTAPNCGSDDVFRHAPQVTTYDAVGLNADIVFTVTFDESAAAGAWYLPFEVCYQAQTPFTDYFGNTGVTTGLLPQCGNPAVAPCYESIVQPPYNPANTGTVVETILVPPSDPPRFH